MSTITQRPFDVILFDLGGVLIELAGVSRMLELLEHKVNVEELWARWLASSSVRDFETGKLTAEQFGDAALIEFGLPISAAQFLDEFTAWPKGLYPGATDLLQSLASHYTLACLTNTNALHWPRISDEWGLLPHFQKHFASHMLGLIKPDREIFEHVVQELACPPERILFLDDNTLNIEAAKVVGMSAYCVDGLSGTIEVLTALKVLPLP